MSGAQQSGFANVLYDPLMAGRQQAQTNVLAQQQLDLTAADHEQVARLSAALLNEPDVAKRGDLYARGVGMLQSQNLAKYAPATLPDEQTLRILAAQGVSSEKQFEYGAGRTAAQGALGALNIGSTGTGTGTTGTPGGNVATAPSGTIEPVAFNNATAVRDGLIKRGMDPDAATGAAANALHESVANPRTGRGDKGNAAGIFMWTGPRLQAYIDKNGHPPDGSPLDEQLDFLMDEWKGSEASAAAKVAEAQGPAAKAAAFSQYFLRPKDTTGEMQRRSATALQLQRQLASTAQPGAPGGATAPGVAMGDPNRPDLAPPPPGGTAGIPAPYQASGGGIGSVLGGAARVARPTSPTGAPIVTDQPAGGGVVAGPPSAAVVGQPTPPSAAVPGNVGAINAGIVRAGGAPAIAAQPEPGWGTVVGTYGPQNQLTPPPAPATTAAAPPAATTAPAATAPAPAPLVPLAPMLKLQPSGLTAEQEALFRDQANRPQSLAQAQALATRVEAQIAHNQTYNAQAEQHNFDRQHQAQADAQAQQEKALADARAAEQLRLSQVTSQREQDAAAALAEQRRVENERQAESAKRDAQRLALQQKQAEQGSTQNSRDDYTLRTEDPSSQQYADAYVRQKWTIAPNGNVIENDISRYPAPNRNIQRPTFLPAPTPQGLDEVRKADTDAKVITSAIDHYIDVFQATGGGGWDAYFANPTDPKTQQLLGAFDRMKTVLRSPQYYNTGVLQPAEIKLMGEDLVSPQSLRGVFSTPQALATRLGEIKLAVLTRQDAELRSVGKDGVIVRDKADYAKVPDGGRYYDEEGHLKVKSGKQ